MKRYLLLFLLLLLTPVQAQAAVVWFAGHESGDFNDYSQLDVSAGNANHTIVCTTSGDCTGATCTDNSHNPHSGCYGAKFTGATVNAGFGLSKKNLNVATIYLRFYFMPLTIPALIQEPIFGTENLIGTHNIINLMMNSDGTTKLCVNSASSGCTAVASGATVMSINNWYLIEAKAVVSATVGGMEWKINGVTQATSFGSNTGTSNFDYVLFGPYQSVANNTAVWVFDSIAISDSGYLGGGISIARQGKAGSPTYTAWTKNSCTSSLIENCWSQTPFNATPNASSATANDAQTMVVSDFSSVQTGHGSQVIGATDVINGCKVLAIAKSGTASAPFSIRRRLGGTDTDSAKTLTTSDAAYDDGYWTTSLDNLRVNTIEIGAVHGTGVATDTVEDMWMMCDIGAGRPQRQVYQD